VGFGEWWNLPFRVMLGLVVVFFGLQTIGIAPHGGDADADAAGLFGLFLNSFVGWATVLFLLAEEGHNRSVTTIWDAYHDIATSLSVGYANIFPVTPMGRAIGAVVMTVGPAMSGRALEATPAPTAEGESAIVAKLDEILQVLRSRDASG
jgi:hypothetical protein